MGIKVSDECINLQTPKQEKKQEELQEVKEYTPPSILDNPNQGYSDHFANVEAANKQQAEMAQMEFEQTLEQQKRDKFKFPTDGKVWHFHPIAFVEQMRRMGSNVWYDNVEVLFNSSLKEWRRNVVCEKSKYILNNAGYKSENTNIIITSTIRTPEIQAQAMYNTKVRYGVNGEKVKTIRDLEKSKGSSKEAVINAMVKKIMELEKQGKRVSLHCVSEEQYKKLNVIDISYKNLKNPKDFVRFLNEQESVTRIIHPITGCIKSDKISYDKGEPAIHVEIKQ